MSTPKDKPKPALDEGGLRHLINYALAHDYVDESDHSEFDHPERGISTDDVLHGLAQKDWKLIRQPNYDEEHRCWEYLIQTKDIEGDELEVKVAALPDYKRIIIITRW